MKIAVIYFTKTDVTGKLAQEVIKGICGAEPDAVILEHRIDGKEIVEGRFINPTLWLCCVIHFRSRVALLRLIVSQYGKF